MTEIQEYNPIEAGLDVLRARYLGRRYECTTPDGMKTAKAARRDVAKYRTTLEKTRKEIKAPALARCKAIDAEAKRITCELLRIETPIAEQIDAEEAKIEAERQRRAQEERERVERAERQIAAVSQPVFDLIDASADKIQDQIRRTSALELPDGEFRERAEEARARTLSKLDGMHVAALNRERERAELAKERERADSARKAAEAAQAETERERARLDAERAAMAAEQTPPKTVELQAVPDVERDDKVTLEQIAAELEAFAGSWSHVDSLGPVLNAIRLWIGDYRRGAL